MDSGLSYVEIGASREDARVVVILMHGLGADGHDFADVASSMCQAADPRKWRFVLPHAPVQPVTINMGMLMPSWYDILDLSHPREVNWDSVETSRASIDALIEQETVPTMVLAGFSQGAAMALHVGLRQTRSIAGVLMMSGYLLESEAHPCPEKSREIPIGIFHGSEDGMVPIQAAERTLEALKTAGHGPTLNVYEGIEHAVCDEEIRDVYDWLEQAT
ncbi:MAG: phospholipase/carboxylesterase [Verrucomicrobiales bacterium]|jgi:phospholipase/carboxylesterase